MSNKKTRASVVGRRFLRPEQLDSALLEIEGLAEACEINVALGGGVAMQLWAYLEVAYTLMNFVHDEDIEVEQFIRLNIVAHLMVKADHLAPLMKDPVDR